MTSSSTISENLGRRVRLGNKHLALAFDGRTGELIELCKQSTGENLLKNWFGSRSMPFCIDISNTEGASLQLKAPTYHQVLADAKLRPEFTFDKTTSGGETLCIRYEQLYAENGPVDMSACVTVTLEDDCESIWELELDCGQSFAEVVPNGRVSAIKFPCVFGVYHGRTWEQDTLVYPFNSGEKIVNPVETYARKPAQVGWKWQQYKYRYHRDGISTETDADGAHFREHKHSGPLSMLWLDYYGQDQGLYLACYDEDKSVAALHAETFGPDQPGMGFYVVKYPDLRPGDTWKSGRCAIALHSGDWHWGADRYRTWHANHMNTDCVPASSVPPEWLKTNAGLVAHYDFKYQSGDVVHRFSDLGRLFDEAQEMGLNHLLLSGWHIDGFDHGFPQYRPDPDLGTGEELAAQIKEIHAKGGRVGFYLNSRLINQKYKDLEPLIKRAGVYNIAGELKTECYGDNGISFAVMSPNSDEWRDRVYDAIRYIAEEAGADSVYLDQLAMSPPQLCRQAGSDQGVDGWNLGYEKLLERVRADFELAVFYEGVSDIHGRQADGQLISTFFYHYTGAFPELYRYTFPEQLLIDMVYPERGQAMRPVHISQASREMIDRAFITGCYLWAYDLEDENSFRDDPKMMAYLKRVIQLRQFWLQQWGAGSFKDDLAFDAMSPEQTIAKHFSLGELADLVLVANAADSSEWSLNFNTNGRTLRRATVYRLGDEIAPVEIEWKLNDAGEVRLTDNQAAALAVVHLEY